MKRQVIVALAAGLLAAAPAFAQAAPTTGSGRAQTEPAEFEGLSFSSRVLDKRYAPPKPARMLAGTEIAPDTQFGLGLFDTMPKSRGSALESVEPVPRRSRKPRIGLLVKF
jgi:hypothetical protein